MKINLSKILFNNFNIYLILSFISGCLLPLSYAPYNLYVFAVISIVCLLFTWQNQTSKNSFILGLMFGLGYFGCGVSWIYISIHNYGNDNQFIGIGITALFIFILALFPASTGYCFQKYFRNSEYSSRIKYLCVLPSLWALFDWVRSWFFSGFPWLLLGQSQLHSPLKGFIPIVGIYGLSFLVTFSAGTLFLIIKNLLATPKKYIDILVYILIILLTWTLGYQLSFIEWTKPLSPQPIQVKLIQGNIPISLKWTPEFALKSFDLYHNLSFYHNHNMLVIWPETAITFFPEEGRYLINQLNTQANQNHLAIITGIPIALNKNFYNGAAVFGEGSGKYLKRHLVPFGEYTPFQYWIGRLLNFLHLPMSDFSQGPQKQSLLQAFHMKIAPLICYEVAYSSLLHTDLPEANLLVTLSNDSWFGKSNALYQHQEIAQLAALMSGRYMLVATNSGETVIINPHGNILAKAPIDTVYVLPSTVYGMTGSTPWVKIGDWPYLLFFIVFLFMIKYFWIKK